MTGALVGGKSGLLQSKEDDLGGFLLLIDPAAFGELKEFKEQTTKLVNDIQLVPPAEGFTEVRTPGQRGQQLRTKQLEQGYIEVTHHEYDQFVKDYERLTGKSINLKLNNR